MHSAPRLLEIMVTLMHNKGDIDLFGRKLQNPPLVGLKAGKLLGLCEEEETTLGPTFPMKDSQLPH